MARLRDRLEAWFSSLGLLIFDHPIKTLVLILAMTGLLMGQIPKLTVDTSTEGFLHDNDPALTVYEKFRDQFGRDEMIIVALKPDNVFDLDFLSRLRTLHRDLEDNLPFLEDITSLINARNTRGQGDELIVEDLLENWPDNQQALEAVKQRAAENIMYQNMLLSEDLSFTTLVIQTQAYSHGNQESSGADDFRDADFDDAAFDDAQRPKSLESGIPPGGPGSRKALTDEENSRIIRAVEEIVGRHDMGNTEIYIAGSPVVSDFLKRTMVSDMKKFIKIVVLTIALFLLIMFRRISGVIMPLIIVVLSLGSTLGLMALCHTALKLPTQILPSFILAVGVGDSVHILVLFFQHFNRHCNKKEAIAHALGHSGLAILLTSLTTAGGLASFSTAAVAPVADLGQFAAAGVILALIYTVVVLPALIALVPLKPKAIPEKGLNTPSFSDRFLAGIAAVSIRRPRTVLALASVILLISVMGAARIKISHNPMKWLPPTNPARTANEIIDDQLRGTTSLEVIVDTGEENRLYDPGFLNRLEEAAIRFESFEDGKVYVGKAWSINTVIKETNQALHENRAQFYTLPRDKDLVAQELLLFENSGSDDLEDFTDSGFSKARFTIKVPFIDAVAYTNFIDRVHAHFTQAFPRANIEMTGMVSLFTRVITAAIFSMQESYFYAMIIITVLMVLLIGDIRLGLLSMIPNLAPIVTMIGIMGWAGIPMDLFCMLVGSIAIGLAVDDTIHFMHNFRRYFDETQSPREAVRKTLATAGRAMLVTTCVLSLGFFTFMFASMGNLFNFGMLTGLTIFMALISDYFIAPALMILVNPEKSGSKKTVDPPLLQKT